MVGVREDDDATPRSSRLAFLALLLALVDSSRKWSRIFILGESCMFPASPDAAREREFVTRPVPSSAADVRHHC